MRHTVREKDQTGIHCQAQKRLKKLLWELADVFVRVDLRMPYFNQTPKDCAEKLKQIVNTTNELLKLLKPLEHVDGQDLESTPFDFPLVLAIKGEFETNLIFSTARNNNGISQSQLDEISKKTHLYPMKLIEELKAFREAASKAESKIKPSRGNSTDRTTKTKVMQSIAKNFTWQYLQIFSCYPASTQDGWPAQQLDEVFHHYELGVDRGSYWIAREVKRLKQARGESR